ncbi:hypothetical protein HAX54_010449, partial [Datura stramonium]|nr:hypothetical protein [Datura stramonium]
DYDDGYCGNQGRNNVLFVDTSSQGSTEVLPPHMESTLEVVLEKVLATKEGVQDLQSKLLDLTSTVKSHEWEMEEEGIEELIVDAFLKGEEFKEIHDVHKEVKQWDENQIGEPPLRTREAQFKCRQNQAPIPSSALNVPRRTSEPAGESPGKSAKRRLTTDLASIIMFQGIFTIPVDPYFPELVWEFYASYRAQQQLMKLEDRTEAFPCLTSVWVRGQEVQVTPEEINSLYWEEPISPHPILRQKIEDKENQFQWNTSKVPIEVMILLECIMKHVHINMGEIIADQFKQKAKQQAIALPLSSLLSMLCLRAECPLWHSLDKTIQDHGVITLDTKIDKAGPMIKRAREKMHENQLVRLSKAIPSMIQSALKKALQPVMDKLTHLGSKVDVLESEATTLQQEVATYTAYTNRPMPYDPEAVPPQVEAP